MFVLPKSQKGVLEQKRDFPEKARQEVQLVSNFSSYATPIVTMNNLTLCNISNPYEIDQVSPVLSSGGRVVDRMSPNAEKPGETNRGNIGGTINNARRQSQTIQHI